MENEGNIPLCGNIIIYRFSIKENRALFLLFKTSDHSQSRSFPRAGWTQQDEEFPILDIKRYIFQGSHPRKLLGHMLQFDVAH